MKSGICAVIVILILVSFSGCTHSDSDDKEKLPNYVYGYQVKTNAEDNQSYRLILPILMNNSGDNHQEIFILDDLHYEPPQFNFTNGSGNYSIVETKYGKGIEIIANGSIYLRGVEHARHPYGDWWQETFLSFVINQSGEDMYGHGTPFLFYSYFEGYCGMENITIEYFHASLSFQMHVDRFHGENITLVNGWNEITIHHNFLS